MRGHIDNWVLEVICSLPSEEERKGLLMTPLYMGASYVIL